MPEDQDEKKIGDIRDVCDFYLHWGAMRKIIELAPHQEAAFSIDQKKCIYWMIQTMDRIGFDDIANAAEMKSADHGHVLC